MRMSDIKKKMDETLERVDHAFKKAARSTKDALTRGSTSIRGLRISENIGIVTDTVLKKFTQSAPKAKGSFVLEWVAVYQWKHNPFDKEFDTVVGQQKFKDKLNLFVIKNLRFGTIRGKVGSGRSTMLSWLSTHLLKFKEKIVRIHISCEHQIGSSRIIEEITTPLLSLLDKTVNKDSLVIDHTTYQEVISERLEGRRLTILVDDAEHLLDDAVHTLKELLDSKLNCQVILCGDEKNVKRIAKVLAVKDSLGLITTGLKFDEAREMLKLRIEKAHGRDIMPFDDTSLKKLYTKSQGNLNTFLNMCQNDAIKRSLKYQSIDIGKYYEEYDKQKILILQQKGKDKLQRLEAQAEKDKERGDSLVSQYMDKLATKELSADIAEAPADEKIAVESTNELEHTNKLISELAAQTMQEAEAEVEKKEDDTSVIEHTQEVVEGVIAKEHKIQNQPASDLSDEEIKELQKLTKIGKKHKKKR